MSKEKLLFVKNGFGGGGGFGSGGGGFGGGLTPFQQAVQPKPPTQFGAQQPDGSFVFRDTSGAEVKLTRVLGRSAPNTYIVNKGNFGEWKSLDPKSGGFVAGSGVAGGSGFSRTLGAYRGTVPAEHVAPLSAWLGGGLFHGALGSGGD